MLIPVVTRYKAIAVMKQAKTRYALTDPVCDRGHTSMPTSKNSYAFSCDGLPPKKSYCFSRNDPLRETSIESFSHIRW